MKKWMFVIMLLICIPGIAWMQQVQFPDYKGWVNDFAGMISPNDEQRIEQIADELKVKTGAELAIVTVKDMGGLEIEEYSVDLFEKWGVGEQDKDNGVMLIMAEAERKVRIEVGYGLEGILPDGLCGEILDTYVVPWELWRAVCWQTALRRATDWCLG